MIAFKVTNPIGYKLLAVLISKTVLTIPVVKL